MARLRASRSGVASPVRASRYGVASPVRASRSGEASPVRAAHPAAPGAPARTKAQIVLADEGATLLDVVDNVLTKGVVLTGDLVLALANVDLVYARLSLLLCAADSVTDSIERRRNRELTRPAPRRPGRRG
jgi:hypothetical protein